MDAGGHFGADGADGADRRGKAGLMEGGMFKHHRTAAGQRPTRRLIDSESKIPFARILPVAPTTPDHSTTHPLPCFAASFRVVGAFRDKVVSPHPSAPSVPSATNGLTATIRAVRAGARRPAPDEE